MASEQSSRPADPRLGIRIGDAARGQVITLGDASGSSRPSDRLGSERFVVRGRIVEMDGGVGVDRPSLTSVVVRAYDKDLRTESMLGESVSDAKGRYQITYTADQFNRDEKRTADLIVRAFDQDEKTLASSEILFNARPIEIVDLTIRTGEGASEFERYVRELKPIQQDVALQDLTEADVQFLHGETRIPAEHIALLSVAHKHASKTRIAPEAFYGLFRQDLPTNLPALLLQPPRVLRDALQRSVAAMIVPKQFGDNVTHIAEDLHILLGSEVLQTGYAPILDASGVPASLQEKFLRLYLQQQDEKSPEELWTALRGDPDLAKDGLIDDIEFALQAGVFTRNNPSLVKSLQALRHEGVVRTTRDMVKLKASQWEAMIISAKNETGIAFPLEILGETEKDKTEFYARLIAETLKQAFPTDAIAIGVAEAPDQLFGENGTAVRLDLSRFFENAPDFDFRQTRIDRYLAREGDRALSGVADKAAVTSQLKRLQRIFNVAPHWDHIHALLGEGFDSAFAIASVPRNIFVKRMGPLMGGETFAMSAHGNAWQTAGLMMNVAAALHQSIYQGPAAIGGGKTDALKDTPTLAKLFGSMDMCECQHCRSVYGPASYFVDLLQFIRKSSATLYTRLKERRPDLPYIELTCENSETPLPYLDLVNEILEYFVVHDGLGQDLAQNTAEISAEELSVNPQHTLEDAYEKLKSAVHSFQLPFNRPLEVARGYLEHLGTSRHDLMAAFQNRDNGTPSDVALALEYLKISTQEYDILTGASMGKQPREFFGYAPNNSTNNWNDALKKVPEFLRRTGVTYPDLVEVLKTRHVNAGQALAVLPDDLIVLFSPDSTCDLDKTLIQHLHAPLDLTDQEWLKLHRFLRLWKKLGWTVQEVDKTLQAFSATGIDDELLLNLARLQKLRAEQKLPVVRLLSLWAPLDVFGDNSLYNSLFRNRAVITPLDDAFKLAAPPGPPQIQGDTSEMTLSAHVPAILAALRIGADDLTRLREGSKLSADNAPLTLENLSTLHRHAFFARALKLKIKDLLAFMVLMGVDPAEPPTTAETEVFVERFRRVQSSGFAVAQLNYLYRHLFDPPSKTAPLKDTVILLLQQLQEALRKIIDETALVPDPLGDVLRAKMSLAIDPTLVDTAMGIIEVKPPSTDGEKQQNEAFIDKNFAAFLDSVQAKTVLVHSPNLSAEEKRAYVFAPLLAYLRRSFSRSLVNERLSDALPLEGALTKLYLETVLQSQTGSGKPAMDDFLALVGDGLSATYFDNKDLNGLPVLSRIDPNVSFYWGEGSPNDQIPAESFSVSWKGLLLVPRDEDFTFYVRAKDGVKLWVDSLADPTIDAWQDKPQVVEYPSPPMALQAGHAYSIRIDYYANSPHSGIELSWSSLSTPKSIIPQSQLYSGKNFVPLDGLLQSYYRLHKIAVLANTFDLKPEEAEYFSVHGADFANFDVGALPLERTEQTDANAVILFKSWERLCDYFTLREKLPPSDQVKLPDLLAAFSTEFPALLATFTGWSEDDINVLFLTGPDGLGLPGTAFKNADGLTRLQTAFALSERLGVDVRKLRAWAKDTPSKEQANEIIHIVKARYDEEQWLAAAKPLNDDLREMQRDALVAYLLAHEKIVAANVADINRLFEYLFIDVAMDACMTTSRLKQAISSVQLFIHRVLMNLEEGLLPTLLDRRQWDWMKNYRVWEANRKVFLYPENWIEPDLRDDKSPFFTDLENQLLQNEITDVNVEDAFLSYLHKLDEVSRLEICGVYREQDSGVDIVHVFGRTNNTPPVHYYRRYDVKIGAWTSWEKMALDIELDLIIPVIWNRRLYVFWPTFTQKPDEKQRRGGPNLMAENATIEKWLQDKEAFDTSRGRREQWEDARDVWETLRATLSTIDVTVNSYSSAIESPSLTPDPGPLVNTNEEWVLKKEAYDMSNGRRQEWPKGNDLWESLRSALKDEDVTISDYPVPLPAQAENPGPHPTQDVQVPPPLTYLEIKLSWSEYRQNRWSAKKTARATLKSGTYTTDDGEEKLPEPSDHRFQAGIYKGALLIGCYSRRKGSPDPSYLERAALIGYFFIGGCQDEVAAYGAIKIGKGLNSPSEFLTPDRSRMDFMRFDEDPSGDTLTFYGPPPTLEAFPVLKDSPSLYRLAHPPYSIEPKAGGFAKVIYPFGYQDAIRSFIALPALDKEPPSRGIGRPAKPQITIGFHDALLTKIFIDKGDPAPEIDITNPAIPGGMTSTSDLVGNFGLALGGDPLFLRSKMIEGTAGTETPGTDMEMPTASMGADAQQSLSILVNTAAAGFINAMRVYLKFYIFYHPHVCEFVRRLNRDGIPGFMARETQQLTNEAAAAASLNNHGTVFYKQYKPSADVHWSYPLEDVDFRQQGAYSIYNWELFFHAPLLIGDRLSRNQHFQEAQDWFHLIFDPTTGTDLRTPVRYWKTLPFFENSHPENQQIVTLLKALDPDNPDKKTRDEVNKQVALWRTNPFKPHLIARLRVTAYQKTVVMKYIDNLIAWGDQLFSRDTIESINEATQLYILAYNILGRRPEDIPHRGKIASKAYDDLIPDLDSFSNAVVEMENEFPFDSVSEPADGDGAGANDGLGTTNTFYFCIPRNEKLLGYWDTVEDRLFKIRHCMNIEGVVRELPLFEPRIDPALLVKATAMGLDLSSVLNDISSPLPCYRFSVLAQKAVELCSELKSLGGLLLSTLEKKDAEELAALRSGHETALLKAAREIKKSQIQEAATNVAALERSRDVVDERRNFYDQALLLGLSAHEQAHLDKLKAANDKQSAAIIYELSAQGASNIPDITAGTSGSMASPVLTAIFGGKNLVSAFQAYARYLNGEASDATYQAGKSSIEGANRRRADDWKLQKDLATKELMQIERQIAAGQIRVAMAERELENHDKQIENNLAVEEFMRDKYTNQELYGWMLSQVSAVYFQTYKLAYDTARRAEKAYRFERGLTTSNFIQFGYWDSLRRGLLAGESLHLDLKRMETAYLDQNKREYELTKHVSLRVLDPRAFLTLKKTGRCFIELSETVFDRDYPGHYMRRLKNVSLTIPCIIGPYTNVNATLTLLSSKTRIDPNAQRPYLEEETDDPRFLSRFGALQSIATSSGQNDGGLFELNFRDDRYLPFEGAGAVSKWRLDMPKVCNAFDYATISDIILNVSFTAREGGDLLREAALQALQPPAEATQTPTTTPITEPDQIGLPRLFSARHEFPSNWYRFFHPADAAKEQTLMLDLSNDRFPFRSAGKTLELSSIDVFLKLKEGLIYQDNASDNLRFAFRQVAEDENEEAVEFTDKVFKVSGSPVSQLPHSQAFEDSDGPQPLGTWSLVIEEEDLANLQPEFLKTTVAINNSEVSRLALDVIDDLFILCRYSAVATIS